MELTEPLVTELVEGLEPVRPLPRLRSVAGLALVLGAVASAGVMAVRGVRPDLAVVALNPAMGLLAIGLAAVALGGIATSLGAATPGRERVARVGLMALLAGFTIASGAAGWGLVSTGAAAWEGIWIGCLWMAALAGLLPSVALLAFVIRALPQWPAGAIAAAAGGSVALAGLSVLASCPASGWGHVLFEHTLAPLLGGAALSVVLYPVLRWLRE